MGKATTLANLGVLMAAVSSYTNADNKLIFTPRMGGIGGSITCIGVRNQ